MLYMIRFGEIGLKSQSVRKRFMNILKGNITHAMEALGSEYMLKEDRGRLYLYAGQEAMTILEHTFGVVSISPAVETDSSVDSIASSMLDMAGELPENSSFAVRARRTGTHKYTSMELAAELGSRVLDARPDLHVDLRTPDRELFVEVRNNKAFVFNEVIRGPGGLPVGTQGRVLCPVTNSADVKAGLLLARRGCSPVFAFSHEMPIMKKWLPGNRIHLADPIDFNDAKLADTAKELGCRAIVLPWAAEEAKGRTGDIPTGFPVFLPLLAPPPFYYKMEEST